MSQPLCINKFFVPKHFHTFLNLYLICFKLFCYPNRAIVCVFNISFITAKYVLNHSKLKLSSLFFFFYFRLKHANRQFNPRASESLAGRVWPWAKNTDFVRVAVSVVFIFGCESKTNTFSTGTDIGVQSGSTSCFRNSGYRKKWHSQIFAMTCGQKKPQNRR